MAKSYSIIFTTAPNKKEAEKIAKILVNKKLVACVQMFPIKSFYVWKKKTGKDNEILILIKSQSDKFLQIQKMIKENHSYEIAEIIEIKINKGSKDYLAWIDSCLK